MKKTNDELLAELEDIQQKYSDLEANYSNWKKNDEELRLRLMFFEGIANSTFDGFSVVDPNSQKILQTQRTIELWKIPKEVVDDPSGIKQVGHVMHMTVNPQKFIDEINYQREHPTEKRHDDIELIDGTVLERYSSPLFGPDGTHYGRIWSFHDITDRKNFEKQLVHLNADKDRFISILSHDLRSPFQTLLGFSELLTENLPELSMEELKSYATSINNIAHKTFDLLDDTPPVGKLSIRKDPISPLKFNLSAVISEVIDILEPVAISKNIKLTKRINEELNINADVYMIKAILRNLVSNAIKFTNKSGKIEISAIHNGSETVIKVMDNGVGMKNELKEKLFSISSISSSKGTANESEQASA